MMDLVNLEEVLKLRQHITIEHWELLGAVAQVYGCKPLESDEFNFMIFLLNIFDAGIVQGKREGRLQHKHTNIKRVGIA